MAVIKGRWEVKHDNDTFAGYLWQIVVGSNTYNFDTSAQEHKAAGELLAKFRSAQVREGAGMHQLRACYPLTGPQRHLLLCHDTITDSGPQRRAAVAISVQSPTVSRSGSQASQIAQVASAARVRAQSPARTIASMPSPAPAPAGASASTASDKTP